MRDVSQIEVLDRARAEGSLWVAVDESDKPVGFAWVRILDGVAHLEEIDVLPAHGRLGIGTALVATVCNWAGSAGYKAVTLSTFRDVPWNAPFYARHGFRPLDSGELTAGLSHLRELERGIGLRTDLRVIMRCETAAVRRPAR